LKVAESDADAPVCEATSTSGGVTGDGGVLEDLDNSSASDPHRRAWRRPERSSTAEAKETEPFAQAASEIAELMQRFVEEVGAAKRDAQVAAGAPGAAPADPEPIRLEAIKPRADAEAEAIRIIDGARAEADRIRREAETR